jgi:ABC-type branched-subunit amino acid transport system substrate-binding protein
LGGGTPAPTTTDQPPATTVGTGQVRVGLILPLSAPGNAGIAATSMKNAAEMALAEFKEPNIQLLVKDDAGTPQGAQAGAQQAIAEGAEIIIGPLFAQSVSAVGQVARASNVPVIAFSTDASVATRGVYLLSFLPESDVKRIVDFTAARGKRSFAALLPDNGYGAVVEAAFQQGARRNGRMVARWRNIRSIPARWSIDRGLAQAASRADSILIADGADAVPQVVASLAASGVNPKRMQLLGTGLWDEPRIFSTAALGGGWYAAPESTGFRNFSGRYRSRFGQDPVRTATLAYDAVALVAALVKQQPSPQRFSEQTLTSPSGFAGIDGIFRFRSDGTNERGLAVMRVAPSGGQVISPAPRAFNPGT